MDGVVGFVDGGPATGKTAAGSVFWAGTDRIAIDAVGVAILKHLGSNDDIMMHRIFEQRQIARAAELGIGVSAAEKIDLIAADDKSRSYRDAIQKHLSKG
jgi:uncharacterized protein (DUF362 family)